MGLVKRWNTWWMSFTYQGQQVRRSTGTADKRLAEAILREGESSDYRRAIL